MSARSCMTHRAFVERDTASGTDAHGHPVKPVFTVLVTEPCFFWSKQRRDVVDGDKSALVEDLRCTLPLGTTVLPGDHFSKIEDRKGTQLLAGVVEVETTQYKHDHMEAALRRVN